VGSPIRDLEEIRRSLEERRHELEAELGRLTEPPTEGAAVSFGKRVGDGTAEAVERLSTTATARSIASSIADIDRALEKIEDGSYGICDGCGEKIGDARLEALPAASLCVDCASRR
jgi:DnaK suppressor protein